jgi:heat shock protein HtpX
VRGGDDGNGVRTAALLAALGGLLVWLGAQFGQTGALIGLVLGLATVGGSYWFSDRLALMAARAVPVRPDDLPAYHRIVQERRPRPVCPCRGST